MNKTIFIIGMVICLTIVAGLPLFRRVSAAPARYLAEIERETESEDREEPRDQPPVQDTAPVGEPIQDETDVRIPTTNIPTTGEDSTGADAPSTTNISTTPNPVPAVAPVISTNYPWAWVLTRVMGISSFLLLTLLSITGMLLTTGLLFRALSPATAWSIHRAIGSALLFSVTGHIVGLLTDDFIKLRLADVFIPFVAKFKPNVIVLGVIGFYLLLLVLATSLYTLTSHAKFWRTIHFLGFPMFLLIFLHGVLIGTDTKTWWMTAIYWVSGGLVGLAVVYRMWWKYRPARNQ